MRAGWSTWVYRDLQITMKFYKVHDIVVNPSR